MVGTGLSIACRYQWLFRIGNQVFLQSSGSSEGSPERGRREKSGEKGWFFIGVRSKVAARGREQASRAQGETEVP